jgi:hypothetical protein
MNAYAHGQLAKLSVADRLLAAERARTARAARTALAHRRGSEPGPRQGAFAARHARVLAWARTA